VLPGPCCSGDGVLSTSRCPWLTAQYCYNNRDVLPCGMLCGCVLHGACAMLHGACAVLHMCLGTTWSCPDRATSRQR
jgi:hypothetical protein